MGMLQKRFVFPHFPNSKRISDTLAIALFRYESLVCVKIHGYRPRTYILVAVKGCSSPDLEAIFFSSRIKNLQYEPVV
jgi:hypothetical protein